VGSVPEAMELSHLDVAALELDFCLTQEISSSIYHYPNISRFIFPIASVALGS
jgi:hypothetical protein